MKDNKINATIAITALARRLKARMRARNVESGGNGLAALRLPMGGPNRGCHTWSGRNSLIVVLRFSLTPSPPPDAAR